MTASAPTESAIPTGDGLPWRVIAAPLIGMFMAVMDGFIVIVAGPAIQADLHTSDAQVQWVLAGYQLSYAVVLITAGRVADRVGRRRVFLVGVGVFTLTSLACAVAPSAQILIGARIVQGVGAALIVPQVFAMITLLVPRADHPRLFGAVSVVIALASMGGQLIGGLLIGADLMGASWRSVFWINLPLGVVIVVLALRRLPESRGQARSRPDLVGVVLLTATLVLLMVPLIQAGRAGWPWWAWTSLAASGTTLVLFVAAERRLERRDREPLLRMSLFRQRTFSVGLALVAACYALLTSYYLTLSISLQQGLGLSALEAGLVYAPAPVVFFTFGVLAGRLIPRHGRRVLDVGSLILAAGYLASVVASRVSGDLAPRWVIPTLMLQAVGGGLVITPSLNVVLSRIRPDTIGMASGALSTAQQVGAAVGVAVVGAVFFTAFDPAVVGDTRAALAGFAASSSTVFVIAVAIALLIRLLPRTTAGERDG